jgi:hypothetical protein
MTNATELTASDEVWVGEFPRCVREVSVALCKRGRLWNRRQRPV